MTYLTELLNLAEVARARRELDIADSYARRALALAEELTPGGLPVADVHSSLAEIAFERGDLRIAERHQRQAQRLEERLMPESVLSGAGLQRLAKIVLARGAAREACSLATRAVALQERSLPDSFYLAESLQTLGRARLRRGENGLALAAFRRGLAVLEAQEGRLGGPQESRTGFRERHRTLYLDTLEAELRAGKRSAAFQTLERSRARALLNLLAERDLALASEAPPELEAARRRNAVLYDQAQGELTEAGTPPERTARLGEELADLRRQRNEIADRIRRASPKLAGLRYPKPLDLAAAIDALDPGTLALAYSFGERHGHLFVLSRDSGLHVLRLRGGEAELRREVASFLARIAPGGPGGPGRGEDPAFRAAASGLYARLLAPAERWIRKADRLLLLPDGPLHRLPFAALIRPDPEERSRTGRAWSYLGEWKPLHSALSLTLYAELRRSRPARPPSRLVAFGDPSYPTPVPGGEAVSGPPQRRLRWTPLPQSRIEVERIAALYGREARTFLGERATEEEAKGLRDADILHFATHGLVDDRSPLDSALVLSIPEAPAEKADNGLLQAWEIFERLRLSADLVVLSACESALGRESSGEGLIGLTWAFQYAGARTVMASLWSVSDPATAELMVRFHRHLTAGLSKDRALLEAQRELISGPLRVEDGSGRKLEIDASAPYDWAAFQLLGDWR